MTKNFENLQIFRKNWAILEKTEENFEKLSQNPEKIEFVCTF